jgi:hypothetical protein
VTAIDKPARLDVVHRELPAVEREARNRLRRVIDSWLDAMNASQLDHVRAQIERLLASEVRQ